MSTLSFGDDVTCRATSQGKFAIERRSVRGASSMSARNAEARTEISIERATAYSKVLRYQLFEAEEAARAAAEKDGGNRL